jgi:hypothetical protein
VVASCQTHTHTHKYIYIYIYILLSVSGSHITKKKRPDKTYPAVYHSQVYFLLSSVTHNPLRLETRSQNWGKRLLASSRLSAWNNSAPTGRIFVKFDLGFFFSTIQVSLKSDKNNGHFT